MFIRCVRVRVVGVKWGGVIVRLEYDGLNVVLFSCWLLVVCYFLKICFKCVRINLVGMGIEEFL